MENKMTRKGLVVEMELFGKWDEYQELAAKEVQKEVKIDGFRKGHVPVQVIKEKYGDHLMGRMVDFLVNKEYPVFAAKNELDLMSKPEVTAVEREGDHLKVSLSVKVFPEVTLGEYKGLDFKAQKAAIKDKDMDQAIEYISQKHAETVDSKEDEAKMGDLVNINYKGSINGIAFPGGTADGVNLKLGTKTFIDTFEDQIAGHKIGEEFEVNVTFPKNYGEPALNGKKALFVVKLNSIKTVLQSEVNDELAVKEGFKTLDELRDHLRKSLEAGQQRNLDEQIFNKIVESIAKDSKISDLPQEIIDRDIEDKKEKFKKAVNRDLTKEEEKGIKEKAEREMRESLVLRTIVRKENIHTTKKEIEDYIKSHFGMKLDDIANSGKYNRFITEVETNLTLSKIKDFIISNNTK